MSNWLWICAGLGLTILAWIGLRGRSVGPRTPRPTPAGCEVIEPLDDLRRMVEAHGLECAVDKGWLLPLGGLPALRVAWHPGEASGRLDVHVLVRPGVLIEECFAGLGPGEQGLRDAWHNFARNSLHVLLAAFWGKLDDDQVAIERWQIGSQPYDAYIGNFGTRATAGVQPPIPQHLFQAIVLAIQTTPLEQDLHWFRFFVGSASGQLTFEALRDNEEWPAGLGCLRGLSWPAAQGYYSVRLFMVLRAAAPA